MINHLSFKKKMNETAVIQIVYCVIFSNVHSPSLLTHGDKPI